MPKILPPSPPYVGPPKWHGSSANKPIRRIVVHCTAGAEPGVKGAARSTASYTKATSRPSSWHYCADSLESVQLTYDSVVAYHDGSNDHSIGYELSCSLSAQGAGHWITPSHVAMLRIAARDIARLCLAYDVPIRRIKAPGIRKDARGITGHNDMRLAFGRTTHWDPGPHFPWRRFLRMVRAEAKRLEAGTVKPAPKPEQTPKAEPRALEVGWWNMRRGRGDKQAAAKEARANLLDHGLDVLVLSETGDYIHQLKALAGTRYIGFEGKPGQADTGILVRDDVPVSEVGIEQMTTAGWFTVRGKMTPRKYMPHALIAGWLRVGSIHTAPSVRFDHDATPEGPVRRVESTRQHARSLVAFAKGKSGALLVPGDYNATPDDRGKFSPWWISRKTGMKLIAPIDATHGKRRVIDFALGRGVTGKAVTQERDGSDHALVTATITEEI